MKGILSILTIFFIGLWAAYHFDLRKPVKKFDRVMSKIYEEISNPQEQ